MKMREVLDARGLIKPWVQAALMTAAVFALAGCTRQSPQKPAPNDARVVVTNPPPDDPEQASIAGGEPCGTVKCATDEVCCNASCGVCTPPGGVCTQQFCAPEPDAATSGVCGADADCRVTSDYCTGCNCRALGPKQELPACAGPGVRCLADPCMAKVAVCKFGHCEAVAKP